MTSVLQEIIDRWHEAHPGFTPLTPASSLTERNSVVVAVAATLPCAQVSVKDASAPTGQIAQTLSARYWPTDAGRRAEGRP